MISIDLLIEPESGILLAACALGHCIPASPLTLSKIFVIKMPITVELVVGYWSRSRTHLERGKGE
jgi:hypothetical protein